MSVTDIEDVDGIPTTVLDLALSDVLCTVPPRTALALADQATALHSVDERERFLCAVAGRLDNRADRRGTRRAVRLLELVDGAAESPPESCLRWVIVDAGFPAPVVQYWIYTSTGVELYRLDMAWPAAKIAVEYDGYEAHVDRRQLDAMRDNDMTLRGWTIIRATAADLRNPTRVLDELSAAFARRRGHIGRVQLPPTGVTGGAPRVPKRPTHVSETANTRV